MRFTARVIVVLVSYFCVFCAIAISPWYVYASGHLENAQDVFSDDDVSMQGIEHAITFTLPQDAQMVSSSDYILIDLPNFQDVTAPTVMGGGYMGNPVFSVSGTTAKVTGVVILPGNTVNILGIRATNPPLLSQFQVSIMIAEDTNGNLIRNIANIQATTFNGTVTVSATVMPSVSSIRISGYSSPGTFITITENGTVIGTDTAGLTGTFSKYLTGIDADTHQFTLYGVDQANRTTSFLNIEIFTPLHQQTTVSNLLLSPTIEIDETEVVQGIDLTVSGSAIPNGSLSIFSESPLRTYTTTAGAQGDWSYVINDTDEYTPGDYHVYSIVQNGTGLQSLFSNSLQFTILPSSGPTPSPAACDVSHGDLNCDNSINLNDFSILMYYWGTTAAAADANSDGAVNLVDFSVLMYYWGT